MAKIAVIFENDHELKRLQRDNEFLIRLMADIEKEIDGGDPDLQQISVAIKQLRGQLGTHKILDGALKPGLIRK